MQQHEPRVRQREIAERRLVVLPVRRLGRAVDVLQRGDLDPVVERLQLVHLGARIGRARDGVDAAHVHGLPRVGRGLLLGLVAVLRGADEERAGPGDDLPGRPRVVEVPVADEDRLRREGDELLGRRRHVVGRVLRLVDVGVEQHDVTVEGSGDAADAEPREDHPVGADRPVGRDVLGAEEVLARRDGLGGQRGGRRGGHRQDGQC
jgi:hypothetical protein